jgi:hypothetical protein
VPQKKVDIKNDSDLEKEELESGAPACPCCTLHMDVVTMEDHLLSDHSPSEYIASLLACAIIHRKK